MSKSEFIIVLTEHLHIGKVFQPFLIHRQDKFYTTEKIIKPYNSNSIGYEFKPYEAKLLAEIDKYSDSRLMKRFSRAKNINEFYAALEPEFLKGTSLPLSGNVCMK